MTSYDEFCLLSDSTPQNLKEICGLAASMVGSPSLLCDFWVFFGIREISFCEKERRG